MITIQLDDHPLDLPDGSTLASLLAQLQRDPASAATALNGRFVPREARPGTALQSGDHVLLFQPIVGG